ncbi:hypothetical protein Tco_1551796, partial [Tanacetum coccineum]
MMLSENLPKKADEKYMGHDRGAFIELKTCNVALLEAADESWGE